MGWVGSLRHGDTLSPPQAHPLQHEVSRVGWGCSTHPAHVPLRHHPGRSSQLAPPTVRTSPPPSAPWAPTLVAAWTCSPRGMTSLVPPVTAAPASRRRAGHRRRPRTWQASWAPGWWAELACWCWAHVPAGAGHPALGTFLYAMVPQFWHVWLICVPPPAESSRIPCVRIMGCSDSSHASFELHCL